MPARKNLLAFALVILEKQLDKKPGSAFTADPGLNRLC
jgi:hypothetical protein